MTNGYQCKIVEDDTLVEMYRCNDEWFVDKTTTLGVDRQIGRFDSRKEALKCYRKFGSEIQ